jgi:GNAT superfamily N-acetyltransferase
VHTPSIREIEIERDAEALTQLMRETQPTAVVNVAAFVHRVRAVPARARLRQWVAEVDGRVVGRADCSLTMFAEGSGIGRVLVAVRGDHQRRGIGTALYDTALEHARRLDVDRLLGNFHENDAGVAFAEARGVRSRACRNRVELDPRLAYVVDIEATHDVPSTEPFEGMAYEEWEEHVLRHPLFTAEGSFVAFDEGEPAAVSLLVADHDAGRAANMFTGTRSVYRGRGHALAVKLASIEWAAANGITKIATYNDATNAPMLAINRRVGYVASGRRVEYVKELK